MRVLKRPRGEKQSADVHAVKAMRIATGEELEDYGRRAPRIWPSPAIAMKEEKFSEQDLFRRMLLRRRPSGGVGAAGGDGVLPLSSLAGPGPRRPSMPSMLRAQARRSEACAPT
jgi:hypothetical protein